MMRFSKFACEEVSSMAVATLELLVATGNFAEAGGSRKERSIEPITTRTAGEQSYSRKGHQIGPTAPSTLIAM
jgi:hypothetical protein